MEDDQTIWFLIWILKKAMPCDQYISQMILESPFQVIQDTFIEYSIKYILKNGQRHGLSRGQNENGQLEYEGYWKNEQLHGPSRGWYENGQLEYEHHWKNEELHGLSLEWYLNGQLWYETNWENGIPVSSKKI